MAGMDTAQLRPQPASRQPAPGRLGLVQAFVNTWDVEVRTDQLATPDALRVWLVSHGLMRPRGAVDAEMHRSALAIREGLRQLALANNAEEPERGKVVAMNQAIEHLGLAPRLSVGGEWQLEAPDEGVASFLAGIVAATASAMADGSWSRMKACSNDTCQWLFYDHSRNRSSHWCTMAVCGSREKARAYRERQREAGERS